MRLLEVPRDVGESIGQNVRTGCAGAGVARRGDVFAVEPGAQRLQSFRLALRDLSDEREVHGERLAEVADDQIEDIWTGRRRDAQRDAFECTFGAILRADVTGDQTQPVRLA